MTQTKVAHMARAFLGVAWAVVFGLAATVAHAAEFKLDKAKSLLVVRTFKDGMGARLAHNHVIQARDSSGTVSFDADNPDTASIKVTIVVASLHVDDLALRKRFGEASEPSDSDKADITKNMLDEDQLYAEKFPTMGFVSTGITKAGEGQVTVKGNLTIRGVTKPVSFPATVEVKDGVFRAKGEVGIKASQFGFKPYSALLGAVRNKDDMTLVLDLVAGPK